MDNPSWSTTDGQILMKSRIEIMGSRHSYTIEIGGSILDFEDDDDFVVISDANLENLPSWMRKRNIQIVPAEQSKNLATCENVITQMKAMACTRKTKVIAVGGGFVQDISTLVSALYMRGLDWTFVPTTLMAMMDSCIGGKSAINVETYKNLIGNFYPPKKIIIDVRFLESLTSDAIASGLAEGIKICFVRNAASYYKFCGLLPDFEKSNYQDAIQIIELVLESKKWFVEADEFDTGVRQLLNFGHTFGHALESSTKYAIPHGIAICFGMVAAINHPQSRGGELEESLEKACQKILQKISPNYQNALEQLHKGDFLKSFANDKKHTESNYRLVLPRDGQVELIDISRGDNADVDIWDAMSGAIRKVLTQ
jgi:3-dehydroquinate synthase